LTQGGYLIQQAVEIIARDVQHLAFPVVVTAALR
jgi:hypothetical protein